MSSEDARRYFTRFIKAYNKGKLPIEYYQLAIKGEDAVVLPKSSSWSLKQTEAEAFQAERINDSVRKAAVSAQAGPSRGAVQGPSMPPSAVQALQDRRAAEEDLEEESRFARDSARRKEKRERKEDEVADRATGKDRLQEKRAEKRAAHGAFADRKADDNGLELPDDVLMGGDDFKARIEARDRAQGWKTSTGARRVEEAAAKLHDRKVMYRQKEDKVRLVRVIFLLS